MADSVTPQGFVKIEVGFSDDTWGQKTNTNWDLADTKIAAAKAAADSAGQVANNAMPRSGGVMTGGLTVPAISVDTQGYLVVSGGNLVLNCDVNDYLYYDRTNGAHVAVVAGGVRLVIAAGETTSQNNLALVNWPTTANHATHKGYVDQLAATKLSLSGGAVGGDLTVYRPSNPASGVFYLGNTGGRYVFYDGTNYVMPGADLYANGGRVWTSSNLNPGAYAPTTGATFTGTLRSTAQIVSQGNGNQTVTCYDAQQGFAVGLMAGAGQGMYWVNADANGNYVGSWRCMADPSGNFTATGNVLAYSDVTLKANILPVRNALETVGKLRGVTFSRIDQADTERRHLGLIAQEVAPHVPEVVNEVDGKLAVNYPALVGLLIEAIKDLRDRLDDLESEVV